MKGNKRTIVIICIMLFLLLSISFLLWNNSKNKNETTSNLSDKTAALSEENNKNTGNTNADKDSEPTASGSTLKLEPGNPAEALPGFPVDVIEILSMDKATGLTYIIREKGHYLEGFNKNIKYILSYTPKESADRVLEEYKKKYGGGTEGLTAASAEIGDYIIFFRKIAYEDPAQIAVDYVVADENRNADEFTRSLTERYVAQEFLVEMIEHTVQLDFVYKSISRTVVYKYNASSDEDIIEYYKQLLPEAEVKAYNASSVSFDMYPLGITIYKDKKQVQINESEYTN